MAAFGEFRPVLGEIARSLRILVKQACDSDTANITSAGEDSSVPVGAKSVAIVKTSEAGTVTITLSDGSTYDMTIIGETFTDASSPAGTLPAYTVSTADAATWKWHAIY